MKGFLQNKFKKDKEETSKITDSQIKDIQSKFELLSAIDKIGNSDSDDSSGGLRSASSMSSTSSRCRRNPPPKKKKVDRLHIEEESIFEKTPTRTKNKKQEKEKTKRRKSIFESATKNKEEEEIKEINKKVLEIEQYLQVQVQSINNVFTTVDQDNSGSIEWNELIDKINTNPQLEVYKLIFKQIDFDGNKSIDRSEFIIYVLEIIMDVPPQIKKQSQQYIKDYDIKRDGKINPRDFDLYLNRNKSKRNQSESRKFLSKYFNDKYQMLDLLKNGFVTQAEIYAWLAGIHSRKQVYNSMDAIRARKNVSGNIMKSLRSPL